MFRLSIVGALCGAAVGWTIKPPRTQYFLDTAELEAYGKWLPTGIFHGVTTNPTILAQAGLPVNYKTIEELHHECVNKYCVKTFMAQAWGEDVQSLMSCARILSDIGGSQKTLVVKLPLTKQGIQAATELRRRSPSVPLCLTACYAPHQVLTACAVGADYVAPYLGRLGDAGQDGIEVVGKMQAIVDHQADLEEPDVHSRIRETRVLVASIRHANQMAELAAQGCDAFTFSPAVADQLFGEPLTEAAAAVFESAATGGKTTAAPEAPEITPPPSVPKAASPAPSEPTRDPAAADVADGIAARPSMPTPTQSLFQPKTLSRSQANIDENNFFDETLEEVGGEAWFLEAPSPAATKGAGGLNGEAAGSGMPSSSPARADDDFWPEELDSVPEDEL